jgi:hypothetical protein
VIIAGASPPRELDWARSSLVAVGTSAPARARTTSRSWSEPGLVDSITQASADAGGGIARWSNVGGSSSPLTGGFPAGDFLYLPSNVTHFSGTPTGATVDGRYVPGASVSPTGPTPLFVAGLWRSRDAATSTGAPGASIVIHGTTLFDSRYLGLATNPFSRGDAEREWALIGQAAL